MGVANDRIRDATHQRPPDATMPPAAHHDEAGSQILGQVNDLPRRLSHRQVRLRDRAPGRTYPFHFGIEQVPASLLGTLLEVLLEHGILQLYAFGIGYVGETMASGALSRT